MKYLFWGLLFFAVAYLIPVSGRPMMRPDEFRYAEIPREMLESGDFVTPRLLRARYFEKPVLGYWLVAASFRVLGENRFALRLPMALAAGMTALLLGMWVRREKRDDEAGFFAALLYLSSALAFALGTTAVLDAVLCLFTTATIICARMAVTTENRGFERAVWLFLCGVCAGLGFLTKGFVAWAVPGSAVAVWLLWERRFKALLYLPFLPSAALAATIFPWVWAVHRADADFWHYFIVVEHFQRFRNVAASQHPEPFWFFIPVLLGTVFPAAAAVFSGFAAGGGVWKRAWRDPVWRFALCGFLPPFIFFSVSSGKLATYILPCYPFLALLAALPTLDALRSGGRGALLAQRVTFDVLGWLMLVGGSGCTALGLALLPPVSLSRVFPELDGAWGFFVLIGLAAVTGGVMLIRLRAAASRRRLAGFFAALALAGAATAAMPDFASDKMPERDLAALRDSGEFDPASILPVTYGQLGHSVAWMLKRSDVRLIRSLGEMEYGEKRAREAKETPLFYNNREFAELLRRADRPPVVYFTLSDSDIPAPFNACPHRRVVRRSLQALVFPAPVPPVR